ncbi:MAG TPA: cytochrome c, partial [Planctomycetota bacterium]|nr:cytochrome c [Planctomycetota bacterium]
ALFAQACAPCHGATGDGQGTTVLDRPARSFKDGGFSFGDTPEALFRTITSGIPGTPMPAFAEGYSEEQRRALARHVGSLAPPRPVVSDAETIVAVTDAPRIVRGILAPIVEGARLVPRGLLVGQPDGTTFQYDIEDVRLLGVRFGQFVRLTDWTGRGGTPLEPLGRVVWTDAGGHPPSRWLVPASEPAAEAELAPYVARLRSTADGQLNYALLADAHDADAVFEVSESGHALAIGEATGFVRRLQPQCPNANGTFAAVLQLDDLSHAERIALVPPPPPSPRIDLSDERTHWWVARALDGSAVLTGVRLEIGFVREVDVSAVATDIGPGLRVQLGFENRKLGVARVTLEISTLLAPQWTEALEARLLAAGTEEH